MVKLVKILLVLVIVIALSQMVSASISIEKTGKTPAVIRELNDPAVFNLTITNEGEGESAEIYTFVGVSMSPRGMFGIPSGQSNLEVRAYPSEDIRSSFSGLFVFEYQIKGSKSGIFKDKLLMNLVDLKDVVEIKVTKLLPEDEEIVISVRNVKNLNLDNLEIRFESDFFDEFSETFSLIPFEGVNVVRSINKEKAKKIKAGTHVLEAELFLKDAKAKTTGAINYFEGEGIAVNRGISGFIVRESTIEKSNEGNVPAEAEIRKKRDIITRLFTSHSVEPTDTTRDGLVVTYLWREELDPGESLVVKSSTNYTFPFIIVVVIILVAFVAKVYTSKALVLRKRVSYVKTKGGEFALKVNLRIKSRKNLSGIEEESLL
jgi:hypothetical protein